MMMNNHPEIADKLMPLEEAVSRFVKNGCQLSIGGFTVTRNPMATVYEIVRERISDLHLVCHSKGQVLDVLIGAGCVKRLEIAYGGNGRFAPTCKKGEFMHNKLISVLIGLALFLGTGTAVAGEKQSTKASVKTKRYYEVMWAAEPAFCEKVRAYADRERSDYVPSDINFGNLKWTELDDPSREASNVIFAGETNQRTVFRFILTRRTGLEWNYDLDIFPGLVDFADLVKELKNPASVILKQEWTFNPDNVELTGMNGRKSPKQSRWCSKLKHNEEYFGCKGRYPKWPFSFFDLIEIDGKTYITAATEKYRSPDDMNLPIVILVGRYNAPPKDTPLRFGSDRTMNQIEHLCYLIKTR